MALTIPQQAEIRRMLGYPALGLALAGYPSVASMFSAFRFLDPSGALETRLSTLSQDEEVELMGAEHPAFPTYAAANVVPPGISWTPDGATTPTYGYVPTIRILEGDVLGSRDNLSFTQAKVVTFRLTELAERRSLIREHKRAMADLLGVPLFPDFAGNSKRSTFRRR